MELVRSSFLGFDDLTFISRSVQPPTPNIQSWTAPKPICCRTINESSAPQRYNRKTAYIRTVLTAFGVFLKEMKNSPKTSSIRWITNAHHGRDAFLWTS